MPYSEKFKLRMIPRLTGPDALSATTLWHEVGVPADAFAVAASRA